MNLVKLMSKFEIHLVELREKIDDSLKQVYQNGPKLLKDPINHVIVGGKRLRPILCMLTAESLGSNSKKVIDAAISIELLHIFSLIHDDIKDNDNLRHGNETIHKKWGLPTGILAGDAVLALAFNGLNKLDNEIKELFNSALIAVCEGQALDLEYENKKNVTIDEYLYMINLKTSHMLGLSSQLGAFIANSDNNTVLKMNTFGKLLGNAFQIQDDLLEVTSDSKIMGKTLNSDYQLNKKTFLYLKAKEIIPDKLELLIKNNNGFSDYKNLLLSEGIVDLTKTYIDNVFDDAVDCILSLKLNNDNLLNFLNYVKDRKC